MGEAFIAVSNDYSSILYNPAGLARLQEGQINLSLDFAASSSFSDFMKEAKDVGDTQGTDQDKFNAAANFLQSKYGKQYSLRTGLLEGFYARPHWGIAVIPLDFTLDMTIHNQVAPAIDVRSYIDTTVAYGFGQDIKGIPGRLSWGATGKFINRGFVAKQFNALDFVKDGDKVLRKEDARDGYTMDFDLGVLYTPYIPSEGFGAGLRYAKPTFGMVVRNVLDYGFGNSFKLINKDAPVQAPERLYRVFDFGSKFELPTMWIFSGRAAVDVRDVGHPSFNIRKGFHAGLELDWTMTSWWKGQYRFGINQGYPTFGLSALFTVFRLDFATYGEDVGTYDNPRENRMYMVKLNIDI